MADFTLDHAVATHEGVLRLEFSRPVYLTGLGDVGDGADPDRYVITPTSDDARPVNVLFAQLTDTTDPAVFSADAAGRFVDVFIDRPFSPYPAAYHIDAYGSAVFDARGPLITLASDVSAPQIAYPAVADFYGAHRQDSDVATTESFAGRDVANVLTASPGGSATTGVGFGAFAYDETGDYGHDTAEAGLRKRLYRRLFTRPGAFLHLGADYGVDIGRYGKRLLLAGFQAQIAASAEQHIAREPEVLRSKVQWRRVAEHPELIFLVVLVRTRAGGSLRFEAPVSVGA